MTDRETRPGSASKNGVCLSVRQRLLLGLLDALGGTSGNQDFQKILFLYCQNLESGKLYDFVPYRRGAFSFTSCFDRRKLVAMGLVKDDDHNWTFTEAGRRVIEDQANTLLSAFVSNLGELRGDDLVADTYRRFPYYAINSEITERVLQGDEEALARIKGEKRKQVSRCLQTIGYEGHSLESYLNTLLTSGVTLLCDVRRNPMSRKYGFAKSTLSSACTGVGMRYEHLPELGIASDQRRELETQEEYDALFAEYEREWLPKQTEALERIQGWIVNNENVALTCFERFPHQCHRHSVAEALEAMSNNGLVAGHL